jgi:hypothetical protein
MLIQFTNGQQIAGIKVASLGDNLTHLLISSAHTGNQQNSRGARAERACCASART